MGRRSAPDLGPTAPCLETPDLGDSNVGLVVLPRETSVTLESHFNAATNLAQVKADEVSSW